MKKKLFNKHINLKTEKKNFIDYKKLNEIENDVNIFLEMKICKICRQKKIIYDFQIDESKDEYLDICIECDPKNYEKICCECNENKGLDEFYTIRDIGYTEICKVCVKRKVSKYKNSKKCIKCNKILPGNNKYFKIAGHYSDYLENSCRVCRGMNYLK